MRIAILSDIHANLEALETVLADCASVDEYWCLGDIVGYGPDPEACVEVISAIASFTVVGNHDRAIVDPEVAKEFNILARMAIEWTYRQLAPSSIEYLRDLALIKNQGPFTVVHGTLRQPFREYTDSIGAVASIFQMLTTPFCLVGHTHRPMIWRKRDHDAIDKSIWKPGTVRLPTTPVILNPGSVGQPRDGDPRASYAIYDDEANTVTLRRVSYPFEITQDKMLLAGMPEPLVLRLGMGH